MEGLRRGGGQHVDEHQGHGAQDRRDARHDRLALGLLVDRHGRVPAPVDEQRQEHAAGQRPEVHVGHEPRGCRMDGPGRVRHVDLGQRDDREDHEHEVLEAQQEPLQAGRHLDADRRDGAHDHQEGYADESDPEERARQAVGPDQQEEVGAGDLRQAGHDDDVGGDHHPAGHPAGPRSDRSGHPAEGGAAVGVCPVQVVVGAGDEDHGDERDEHDRRRLEPDAGDHDDQPQGDCETVGRRRRGYADDDAR